VLGRQTSVIEHALGEQAVLVHQAGKATVRQPAEQLLDVGGIGAGSVLRGPGKVPNG